MEDFGAKAAAIAEELRHAGDVVTPELRARFIELRSEMFQRGIFDPILARFDSATVPQPSTQEVAEQLSRLFATM